jgi:SNF2 family DNA or RNA helicase
LQVVDEGHRLKSSESKLSKALHDLRTEHRILLTGTPLQNNLDELFMLMHFLDATKVGGLIPSFRFCAKSICTSCLFCL